MKLIAMTLLAAAAVFAVTTFAALEASGVVVVRTNGPGQTEPRQTRIWFATTNGKTVLEAGAPQNPWVGDLAHDSILELSGGGVDGTYRATLRDRTSHSHIRALMRQKYGWRDWWIGLVFDTSDSFMIELEPVRTQP